MTASTSAIIKLLLLATVAFAKDLDQDADSSSSRLRGKIKQIVPPSSSSSSRALSGIPPGTLTGTGTGKCPTTPQVTGMACAQYVPPGATEASCIVENLQCDCKLQDNIATTEGWNCYMAGPPIPPPTQHPITMVNADIVSTAG